MTGPHCLDCGESFQVTGAGYDGVRLSCGCSAFSRSIYIDWEQVHDAPRPWVYEELSSSSISGRKTELKHLGDHYGRPDPGAYD